MKKPNLFIVGAPKCGTTAMDKFLSQHPDIFMAQKEIHYFGNDLNIQQPKLSEEAYLDLFKKGQEKKILGESSVWYLFSKNAAEQIKKYSPDAKIIVMLRNPVSMVPALHRQNLYDANEDITDVEEAVAATEDRKKGKRLPKNPEHLSCLFYIDAVKYYAQVKRYMDVFGENVHIIIYDDFKADNLKVFKEVLHFLQLPTDFEPTIDLVNTAKKLKNQKLQQLVKRPHGPLRSVVRILMPYKPARHFIMQKMETWNLQKATATDASSGLKKYIQNAVKEDVIQLSNLLQRDLSNWLK